MDNKKIFKAFEFVTNSLGEKKHKSSETPQKKIIIKKWIEVLNLHYKENFISLGDRFLWDYLLFQCNRYRDSEVTNDNFIWFFGKKAVSKWLSKSEHWRWAISQSIGEGRFSIYENDFYNYINEDLDLKKLNKYYEKIRKNNNLYECINKTDMFNPASISCIRCINKKSCKEIKKLKN
jgi:hypothetical protein